MVSKLIVTCVTDDEAFDEVILDCQKPISREQWELIKKALPIVLKQAEARLDNEEVSSEEEVKPAEASMTADFEVTKGE